MLKTPRHFRSPAFGLALLSALTATGCSSVGNMLAGDKVDYRSSGAQSVNLAVPPDLTQLPGQARYAQNPTASVSANSVAASANAEAASNANAPTPAVALTEAGAVKLEREGDSRWLAVALPPEQVWEQVKAFWLEAGFELPVALPAAGVMETNWSENRAKLPQTGVRKLLGGIMDSLYDTGERDQYRTRIERTPQGCEIFITHRGVEEVYESARKEETKWVSRPTDRSLEAEMLSRLMVKLGAPKEAAAAAKTQAASSVAAPAAPQPAGIQLQPDGVSLHANDDFETMWRRVGLALDRGDFTIEERDHSQGLYEVRLAKDRTPGKSKRGFFSRLFGGSDESQTLARYRIQVSPASAGSTVRVLDAKGKGETSDTGRRIMKQLLDELS